MEIYEVTEILSALKSVEDESYAIETFSNFIEAASACDHTLLMKTLRTMLSDFAEEENFCRECLVPMDIYTWVEPRPYGSTETPETMNELRCPECGSTY